MRRRRGLQIDAEGREQIRTATLRSDATVAVFHHGHAETGKREHHQTGNIETARMIAACAHDIDGARRPFAHPWIDRPTAKRTGQGRDLGRGLPFVSQGDQPGRFFRLRHLGGSQSLRGQFDLCRGQIAARDQLGGERGQTFHNACESATTQHSRK
ncbi:MAG: hypothetical protein BWX86_00293 [Verrucomicrobia bacterium ADurb.Bin122]|nr:MAG: hypothetical protein BWX86_00293 [Verrucomicrobia bacterium ADurb.Bin122]